MVYIEFHPSFDGILVSLDNYHIRQRNGISYKFSDIVEDTLRRVTGDAAKHQAFKELFQA